ncbi:MAG TPA: ankyrin repeat domain-containing protein, partial [Cyanobacteria bacterium UBA12227]|nr:ankyrin repeat domain-containing protein [Cyanobacteria bacterium UBA12227]
TPLLRAVQNNNNEIAKLLIAKGADVNANKNGYTPLDWAVKNNNEEMVELLKSHGAKR